MALDGVERDRTWLVRSLPDPLPDGTTVCRGDVAVDDEVAVRIHRVGDRRTATVEGRHDDDTTIEWDLTAEQFEALWPLTEGRRLAEVRHEVPIGTRTAAVSVFGGSHAGLVLATVGPGGCSEAFTPPAWFGDEVSDDPRYTDAALTRHGLPTGS